jgi:hypothetical protein
LKKRSKRPLVVGVYACRDRHANVPKFFGSFFQKRTFFLFQLQPAYSAGQPLVPQAFAAVF